MEKEKPENTIQAMLLVRNTGREAGLADPIDKHLMDTDRPKQSSFTEMS